MPLSLFDRVGVNQVCLPLYLSRSLSLSLSLSRSRSLSLFLSRSLSLSLSRSLSLSLGVLGIIKVSRWQQVQALPKYTGTLVQRLIKALPNPYYNRCSVTCVDGLLRWTACA